MTRSGFQWTADDILAAMRLKGHAVFDDPDGYDLNLIGIRTDDDTANTFNDWILALYVSGGQWVMLPFPATTDPGLYYRENPMNVHGTAIVKPGQYRGLWKRGQHRGRYHALVQNAPVTVYRDADKDGALDFDTPEDPGFHGINLHRANPDTASLRVGKFSAGCQVIADPVHFDCIMGLCRQQELRRGWKTFTYTLLEEPDIVPAAR